MKVPGVCGTQPRLKPNPRGPFRREQSLGLQVASVSSCGDGSAAAAGVLLSFTLSSASSSQKRRGDRPNCRKQTKEKNIFWKITLIWMWIMFGKKKNVLTFKPCFLFCWMVSIIPNAWFKKTSIWWSDSHLSVKLQSLQSDGGEGHLLST